MGNFPLRHWVLKTRLVIDANSLQRNFPASSVNWYRKFPPIQESAEETRLELEDITPIDRRWESEIGKRLMGLNSRFRPFGMDYIGGITHNLGWMVANANREKMAINGMEMPHSAESGAPGWRCDPEWRGISIIEKEKRDMRCE